MIVRSRLHWFRMLLVWRGSVLPRILPQQIWMEATERGFLDLDRARTMLAQARRAGHSVAIDDFGVGFSSLQYLEQLPLDALKIDNPPATVLMVGLQGSGKTTTTAKLAKRLKDRNGKRVLLAEGVIDPFLPDRMRSALEKDEAIEEVWLRSRGGDAEAGKHAGLTAVVVDMHGPGVEVRPLRQMTGEAEFNEVYFTDTRIPVSETLGNVGDGWRVSLTTLMNERVAIGGAIPQKGSGPIREAVKLWEKLPTERKDAATKEKLMKLWIRSEVARLTNIRAGQNRKVGVPGPEGSIGKMASADLNKETYEFCIELLGAEGMLYGSYEMVRPDSAMTFDSIPKAFLRARANSIEGGTSEVMRNILGERVLGLPGDVRVDREMPWSKVPRN